MASIWRSRLANKSLQEFRLQFCGSSASSVGMRAFVKNQFSAMKTAAPQLPILVRECKGIEPRVVARYDFGIEKSSSVGGMDEAAIQAAVDSLAQQQPTADSGAAKA